MLSNADFRLVWYVGSLAEFGRRFELLLLSLLMLQITGSDYLLLGLILVFNNLARPLVSLFTGDIADRFNRRKVMLAGQSINLLTVSVMVAAVAYDLELLRPWHLFAAAFIQGLTKAIEDPSRRTAIFDIIGSRRLVNAVSLDVISHNVGKMLGPVAAGVLLDYTNYAAAYAFLLGAHAVNWLLMARLRIPDAVARAAALANPPAAANPPATAATSNPPAAARPPREPLLHSLGEAFRAAWRSPTLVGMLYITIVMNAMAFPVQQFIPAIGQDYLKVGATLVGLLAAADGFGHLAAAGLMTLAREIRFHGRYFTIGSVIVLLMSIAFVWSPWYWVTFALLVLSGIGQAGFSTMQSSIMMLASPPDMRGRMMGLLSVCIGLGHPVGGLIVGTMAAAFAVPLAISVNAAAGLGLLLPAMAVTPLLWRPLTPQTPPPPTPQTPQAA